MIRITLTVVEKQELEKRHRIERDRRVVDRIRAVLFCAEGWTQVEIALALRIFPETVHNHLQEYVESKKLKPANGGSDSKLNAIQTSQLIKYLEDITYTQVGAICAYVYQAYKAEYTVSGMTKWLESNGFSYKKPKGMPAKADAAKQKEFVAAYHELLETTPKAEPILFGDAVHPTMATKIAYGWIKKGVDKPIATIASRTRMNIMGAINLQTMAITYDSYETINSEAMDQYFDTLRAAYPTVTKIHLIVDRGPSNTSMQTRASAEKHSICLHYLPAYSPNLNPVERVWKVMHEYARNNKVFTSAKEFRSAIRTFFDVTWLNIANLMRNRINDNFQTLKPVPSG